MIYSDIGDLERSEDEYKKCIALLERGRDYQQLSRAYNNLGDVYMQREEWDEAMEMFQNCNKYASMLNHQMMIAWSLFNSGEALSKMGNPDKSLDKCKKALELLEKLDDLVGLNAVHRNLGLAYSLKRDWDSAEGHFKESEKILARINSPFNQAHLKLEWGMMNKQKGDKQRAKEMFSEASKIFESIGAKVYLDRADMALKTL